MALKTQGRGPFSGGYTSSVPAFMAREDQLWGQQDGSDTNSSRDCFIDPFSGGVSKRGGCAIQGDTVSGSPGTEVTGLLDAKWGAKSRKVFALDSPSLSDGYPTRAVLYGEDTNAGFPTADSGYPGTVYWWSTNSTANNRQLLREWGTTHYAGTYNGSATASDYKLRMVPIQIESGDGVYNRGQLTGVGTTDSFMRQYLTCGSRSMVQTQDWMYFPNLRATPWRWNKRFNNSASAGSEIFRGFPTGPFGPLYPFTSTVGTQVTDGAAWEAGDTFYVSCVFRFSDGSCSLPFIPRAANGTLSSGLGRVTVGSAGSGLKYLFLTYSNIPIGPEGTVERILLRTTKQNLAASTDTITVAPLDLRVIGVLKNNTQTSYIDYGGDDDTLLEDNDVVRFDLICPKRSRYIGTGDQRVLISYTLPNTSAIMLAPTGAVSSRDKNLADTANALYGTAAYLVRITSTQLELHYNTGVGPDFTAGPGNAKAFLFSTYTTLEALVDAINATDVSSECKQWAAQLAPGVDGSLPSTSLTLTTFDVTATSADTSATLTSSAAFGSVGVGMKVKGGGITSGTYVVSKASASSLTLSTAAANPGTGAGTFTFYQETGDNGIVTGGTVGYMRAFSCTFPLLLCMKPSAFPKYDQPDTSSIYYTLASPGALSSGVSLAPNSWLSGNKLTTHSSPRQQMRRVCTGIADLEGAAVVAYTDGIYMFSNRRGGNTGEDFDYRLFTINDGRGCISYLSLVSGNGWVSYATTEGIVVTDKTGREFVISGDVFNPSDNKGDLAYEILTSAASAASDSDGHYLSCAVMGSRLAVGFRASATNNDPRVMFYDFSPGVEASGVEELLNPDAKRPYIWSPPSIFNLNLGAATLGAMGSIRNASGRLDYITYDSNQGSTGDGRIDLINTGTTDNNAASITSYAIPSPFIPAEFCAMQPQNIEATHLTTAASANIYLANNQTPTFNTASDYARSLNVDANRTQFQKQVIPIAQGQRGRTDMLWSQWRSATGTANRFWRIVLQYDEGPLDVGQQDIN